MIDHLVEWLGRDPARFRQMQARPGSISPERVLMTRPDPDDGVSPIGRVDRMTAPHRGQARPGPRGAAGSPVPRRVQWGQ